MLEHHQTIRQAAESELFRLLVENVHDYAIFIMDPEGRVRSWNPGAERLLGYVEAEVLGQPVGLFFTPEDVRDGVPQREMEKAVETGRDEDARWHVREDGTRFWSAGTITPLWDDGRNLRGFAKIMRDCTARKQGEDALNDALAYAQGVVETVREPMLVLGGDLRVRTANRSFYRAFRVSAADTVGRLIYHLGDGQWNIPRLRTLLEEVLPQNTSFDGFEVEHDFRAIGRKVMLLNARRFTQEGDRAGSILLAMEDVTERRRAEEGRREVETRFTSLVKHVKAHSVFTMDPEGRISSWNREAERILGYSEAEMLGQSFSLIFSPEDLRDGLPEEDLRLAREQGWAEGERWHVRKGGERIWGSGVVTPTHDASGKHTGFSEILRDITEQKLAEEELRRTYDQAETQVDERTAELRIANEQLRGEIEGRKLAKRRLNAQHTTTKLLAEAINLEAAVRQIIEAVCQSMSWSWAAVWMADTRGKELRLVQFWHSPSADMAQFLAACRAKTFSPGEGLPGRVWSAAEPVWVPDIMRDENFFGKHSAAGGGLHAAVGFPIMRGQEVLGVVEFFSQRIEQPDKGLLGMMTAIGSQIGQFIEKKQTENALDEEREFLKAVLENVQDGIVACDSNGVVAFSNRAARESHGRGEGPPPAGRSWGEPDLYHADGKSLMAKEECPLYRASHGERVRDLEFVVRSSGGTSYTLLATGQAITDAGGQKIGAVVVTHDVTERKRAEGVLRASEERYRRIIETTPDGIWTLDADHRISFANRRMADMLGHAVDEMIGRPLFEFMDGESQVTAAASLEGRRNGGAGRLDFKFRRKDGSDLWGVVSAVPVMEDGRNVGTLVIVTDVSERNLLEQQLRQAQKMEAFGQLAGGVAHDFNNLLSVIMGYSELLVSSLRPGDPNREQVEEIYEAGKRATLLTRQLLAFSRKQVVEPQVLDLDSVVASTVKMLGRLIGEDVDLATAPAPALDRVKADPGQVEQVIMNLVVNARDAMPRGGRITIGTANVDLDEGYGDSHAEVVAGRYVLLAVSDTGCGMTEGVKARIFEPFFTTKGVGKGTGLGLATVYGIVKQGGGHVRVYSEIGRGTTFKVYLPSVSGVIPAVEAKAGPAPVLTGTETILVVEDEKAVRAMTRMSLQKNGYTLLEAADGEEALRLCERHQGPIHLLVSDVVMPQMGGRQLAERLTQLRPGMRVLFVSGYTDDAVVRHGVLRAEVAFLQKPFSVDALTRKVRAVLDRPC